MPSETVRRPILAALMLLLAPDAGMAGGGPENTLLVINAASPRSKEIGNHYARLRDLPAVNVLHLDYRGGREQERGPVFREQILLPILEAIERRGIALQIDTIVYSCDFPWRLVMHADYPKGTEFPKPLKPIASLTGATYLYQFVLAKSTGLVTPDTNWYLSPANSVNQRRCQALGAVASRSFRSRYIWKQGGRKTTEPKQGRRYLMSSMLGVTTGRGNTVEEVLTSLKRAVYADASPPVGTFYFVQNGDVRSSTRHACYAEAVGALRRMGAKAEVRRGVLPKGASDVIGLMTGKDKLAIDQAGMTILPGAICEHLTSAGGLLFKKGYQTPISELIRAGATATCGAVEEPYATQSKFPLPSMHLHYRRGCSMAEAYYQSVRSPYQLLLLGDPLCQPWAERPGLEVEGWPAASKPVGSLLRQVSEPTITETEAEPAVQAAPPGDALLRLKPVVTPTVEGRTAFWELYVDGRLRMRLPSGADFALTAEQLGPGWHDLRCVAIDASPIETQRRLVASIEAPDPAAADREGPAISLAAAEQMVSLKGEAVLRVASPGAERIVVRHQQRTVARIEGSDGEARVSAELLGRGPVRLQATAEPSGAASRPIWLSID